MIPSLYSVDCGKLCQGFVFQLHNLKIDWCLTWWAVVTTKEGKAYNVFWMLINTVSVYPKAFSNREGLTLEARLSMYNSIFEYLWWGSIVIQLWWSRVRMNTQYLWVPMDFCPPRSEPSLFLIIVYALGISTCPLSVSQPWLSSKYWFCVRFPCPTSSMQV